MPDRPLVIPAISNQTIKTHNYEENRACTTCAFGSCHFL